MSYFQLASLPNHRTSPRFRIDADFKNDFWSNKISAKTFKLSKHKKASKSQTKGGLPSADFAPLAPMRIDLFFNRWKKCFPTWSFLPWLQSEQIHAVAILAERSLFCSDFLYSSMHVIPGEDETSKKGLAQHFWSQPADSPMWMSHNGLVIFDAEFALFFWIASFPCVGKSKSDRGNFFSQSPVEEARFILFITLKEGSCLWKGFKKQDQILMTPAK